MKIFRRFLFSAEFGVQVAEQELENWILRIARDERLGDRKSPLVILIVRTQASREDEASVDGEEYALIHPQLHLSDSLFFISPGNSHEDTHQPHDRREGIHIVVVNSEGRGGVGHLR